MKQLKKVKFPDCAHFQPHARKEGVSVHDTKNTTWFHFLDNEDILGICALLSLPNGGARIKAFWVKPEYRQAGNGTEMAEQIIALAIKTGAKPIEVIAYNTSFYESRGFKKAGHPRPNNAQRLILS